MLKIAVLVSGGGSNLQCLIDAVDNGSINGEIVKVISTKPNVFALERAKKHNIPSEVIERKKYSDLDKFNEDFLNSVKECHADLVVLAGFLSVLSEKFVKEYENKIVNVHPSLIPSFSGKGFYGLKVHEAALAAGVKLSGATVHFADGGCDSGPIIMQKSVPVLPDDTPQSLQLRVMEECEWVLLPKVVELISKDCVNIVNGKVEIRGEF